VTGILLIAMLKYDVHMNWWRHRKRIEKIYVSRPNQLRWKGKCRPGYIQALPGSISSLKHYPGYTSLSRTLPNIVIRYLHSRLSRAWLWSRDRLKENGGDGVLFFVTTDWVMFVYTQDDIYPFWTNYSRALWHLYPIVVQQFDALEIHL
jgi:hypothetical protein